MHARQLHRAPALATITLKSLVVRRTAKFKLAMALTPTISGRHTNEVHIDTANDDVLKVDGGTGITYVTGWLRPTATDPELLQQPG